MESLLGKRVILTGAGSGIGLALLNRLLDEGPMQIMAVDLQTAKLDPYKERIEIIQCDLGEQENIDLIIDEAVQRFGGIDLFIANAGYAYYGELGAPSWQHIESIYSVNVVSPIYSLEKMVEVCGNAEFSFIVTASAFGKVPMPGYALYSATKSALEGFMRTYQYEKPPNAHVMTVYPIATYTGFFERSGRNVPLPWLRQEPDKVADRIIKGLKKGKWEICPSIRFRILLLLDRFLFFLSPLYGYLEKKKFEKWRQRQKTHPFR